jgi:hypothetical protein
MQTILKMKRMTIVLKVVTLILLTSSCTTMVQMQKTYPPEAELPADSANFVFTNFYDYTIPESIEDKHEVAYAVAVRGYIDGLGEVILKDKGTSFMIIDTLRKGYPVISMQYPEFADTVRALCARYGADMFIALDSINLWTDWDVTMEENDEGGSMLVKDFYLFANNYMTLYTSEGEVIDRCAGEKSSYVKSNYTIFGMLGGMSIVRARDAVRALAHDAAKDCLGKYYPFTETVPVMIYSGGPFKEISRQIIAGHPEEALEPLRKLTQSSDTNIAWKAEHNLSVVNEMLENMRIAEEILKKY